MSNARQSGKGKNLNRSLYLMMAIRCVALRRRESGSYVFRGSMEITTKEIAAKFESDKIYQGFFPCCILITDGFLHTGRTSNSKIHVDRISTSRRHRMLS